MRLLSLWLLLTVSVSCTFLPRDLNPIPSPLLPVQTAVALAVAIEDHVEDPACDAVETSFLEGLADLISAPINAFWQLVAFDASIVLTVGDSLAGNPLQPETRFKQVLAWTPARWSGVPPSLDGKSPTVPPACARA